MGPSASRVVAVDRAGTPGLVGETRLVPHAIAETTRAMDRVISLAETLKERADRAFGAEPEPAKTRLAEALPTGDVPEVVSLSTSLAELHFAIDRLGAMVDRLAKL